MEDFEPFNELLQRHRPMVWRMCWISAHGNYERCRDLVQEVSIALWRHFEQLQPKASPQEERAWVRWQIRSVIDFQRRKKRPLIQPLTDSIADTLVAENLLEKQEELDRLMASLNDDERRMLRLQLEGYRAEEIAEAMGLNRDAVYQRMHRAVGKMRRVALLLAILCVAATVAVAVVPQWRQQVIQHVVEEVTPEKEPQVPEEKPTPAPPKPKAIPTDTVVPRPVWIPPEPLPHLGATVDTILPELPAQKPEVGVMFDGKKFTLTGLMDGELIVIRNTKGVLLALKRAHGSTCTIDFPINPYTPAYTSFILKIGNRPDKIRIDL